MVADPIKGFGDTARGLSKNPLGIIALFIVLVYGMAAVVTALPSSTTAGEKLPLVYFLVLFPVLVLGVFTWLVVCYPANLFGPGDYARGETYVESVTRKVISVSASLGAATARMSKDDQTPVNLERITEAVRRSIPNEDSARSGTRQSSVRKLESWQTRVLWVDDRPEHNRNERAAFEASGLRFELATSTQQALDILREHKFAVIISDMGRKEGSQEGYVLLDELRAQGDKTPFYIYAGSSEQAHRIKTEEHGGQGCTNDPSELYFMVVSEISRRSTKADKSEAP
jgi:CheY-like chemotaxis protein